MAPPRTAARRQRNAQTSTMACLQGVSGAVVICMAVAVFLYAFLLPTNSKMSTNQDASEKGHRGDEAKVIVVGGGLAGLSAAIEAYRHGAQVTIIDKEKNLGGNSAKATSGINAVNTDHQSELSIADSIEKFISDTLQSGDGLSSEHLVKVLAKKSASAISFLESFDLLLSDIVQLGGHSVKRTHRFPPTKDGRAVPVGFTLVSALKKYVNSVVTTRAEREDEFRDIIIINSARFESLLYDDDAVAGIRYTDLDSLNIKSLEGAVILASGGFANDHANDSLLERYVPKLAHLPTTNGAWATGDILKYAQNSKISLVDMNKVQVHPTGFVEPSKPLLLTKFLAPEALRGCGAILLDNNGKRFANELGRRDYLTKKIFESCATFKVVEDNPVVATMVLTQKIIDRFGAPLAGFYQFKKLINKVGPLSKLGEYLGVSQETIDSTLERYNKSAVQGKDEYGKTAFPATFSVLDEYYVAFVTPSLHYCMGGLRIDADACVLGHAPSDAKRGQDATSPRRRIAGLYAAGEVTGGVHGNNRLGGNSLLECVVFGRRAGINSAHYRRG